jgi:DNA-binding MltR family transcriptional regulator
VREVDDEKNENKDDEYDPFWITGKDLERHFSLEQALLEFSQLFKHEEKNDRGLVIVGASFLETLLEHILINFLINDPKEVADLLRYDQPLGSFGNRTRAAYCFGLISKTIRDDLRLIGKIRNRFAHDLSASFDDQQIAAWCTALKWHRVGYMQPPHDAAVRDLFHVGLNQIVCHLNGIVSIARGEKRIAHPDH